MMDYGITDVLGAIRFILTTMELFIAFESYSHFTFIYLKLKQDSMYELYSDESKSSLGTKEVTSPLLELPCEFMLCQ